MRSLLLLPLLLLLAGCGRYGSSKEAKDACWKWAELGGVYKVDYGFRSSYPYRDYPVRRCTMEKETRQWLGVVAPHAEGEVVNYRDHKGRLDSTTVKKRFPF